MKRGKAELNVEAVGGVVVLTASMYGADAVFRLPPDMADALVLQILEASVKASTQFVEAT